MVEVALLWRVGLQNGTGHWWKAGSSREGGMERRMNDASSIMGTGRGGKELGVAVVVGESEGEMDGGLMLKRCSGCRRSRGAVVETSQS